MDAQRPLSRGPARGDSDPQEEHGDPEYAEVESIRPDPSDPSRTRIRLVGGRSLIVDPALVVDLGLARGMRVAGDDLERLLKEGDEGAARARALRFLRDRDRSQVEVERRLARFGYSADTIRPVIEWLVGFGYLDDHRFAESFARSKARAALGPRRIMNELLVRGVDRRLAKEAAEAAGAVEGESSELIDGLVAVVARRFGAELARDPVRARRRIDGYLSRRGHDRDVIRVVIRTVCQVEDDTE